MNTPSDGKVIAMNETSDPLADEREAFRAADKALMDSALDVKLVNDRTAQSPTHAFDVLTEIMAYLSASYRAINALGRLIEKGEQLGAFEDDGAALREARTRMEASYQQYREQAIAVLNEAADLPAVGWVPRPPSP